MQLSEPACSCQSTPTSKTSSFDLKSGYMLNFASKPDLEMIFKKFGKFVCGASVYIFYTLPFLET